MNRKLNNNFNIPSLEDPNGNLLTNEVDKANLFNSTFHKQFTLDDGKDVLPVEKNLTSNSMPHFEPNRICTMHFHQLNIN